MNMSDLKIQKSKNLQAAKSTANPLDAIPETP